APVFVFGPSEVAGETIFLAGAGDGRFTGTFSVDAQGGAQGDQELRVMPGTVISAQYLDADTGSGSSGMSQADARIRVPEDIFCESRTPTGGVTPFPVYQETGTWTNTGTVS